MRTPGNANTIPSRLALALCTLLAATALPAMAADDPCKDILGNNLPPSPGSTDQGSEAGVDNTTCYVSASAYGTVNNASGEFSNAFGRRNLAVGTRSNAFGWANSAYGEGSVAFGGANTANGKESSAFGYQSQALNDYSTAIGWYAVADRDFAVAVGQTGGEHQIIHMADGTEDFDAVNVRQLRTLATWMGGGSSFVAGVFTAPTFTIQGSNFSNVYDAFAAVDTKLTALSGGVPGPVGPAGPEVRLVRLDLRVQMVSVAWIRHMLLPLTS